MINKYLIASEYGFNGIYRAKLITAINESDIRAYIPGLNDVNPFDSNGDIDLKIYEKNKLSYPVVQWCCYNLESKELININGPAWVMFENGDAQRPVCISYSVIGGESNSSASINTDKAKIGTSLSLANSSINNKIEIAILAWEKECNGKSYGRGINQYDCSSSTAYAFIQAGILPGNPNDYNTNNMLEQYSKYGFIDVTSTVGINSYDNLIRGDVLWSNGHTCIYLGSGKMTASNSAKGNHIGNWYKFATKILRYGG